jgi:DNA-binding winged helix-turn-helix (wHTH) protein/tetratricopeptide (TPR) repeat protein
MQATAQSKRSYRFGLFELNASSGELLRQGLRVPLQDQLFRLLNVLLQHAGEVVSREELRAQLWPADTYVDFDGSLNAALKRLRYALGDSPENPIFVETLPKRGYRFIAPVTIEYEEMEAVPTSNSVEGQGSESDRIDKKPEQQTFVKRSSPRIDSSVASRTRPSRAVLYGAALAAVLVLALSSYAFRHPKTHATRIVSNQPPLPAIRKTIAVLGFQNVSGRAEDQWLGIAFSEMLSTELASGDQLRLVSGEDVSNLRLSSPWAQTGTLSPETTARIGAALNSGLLVLGSYANIPASKQLRLDVTLQDSGTGEIVAKVARTSNGQDLFQVISEVGALLRERLGVPEIRDAEEVGVMASIPSDREAARFYALGISKLRQFDAAAAKDLLRQGCEADPKFALCHVMLARAWNQLGYEQKRKEETRKALDLSYNLPRSERMLVEADYYESQPDHEKAASVYRALFELFPDNIEYGLQLLAAQSSAGHASQAQETMAQLRRLPAPASLDPIVDIADAKLQPTIESALALLHSAMQKASSQGKKLVYAQARLNECKGLVYSQHPDRARPSCEEAYKIYLAAGNRLLAADAIRLMADQEGGRGHNEEAIATYQRALNLLAGLGEHAKTGSVLNNMAIAYGNEGKLDRAEQLYRQAKFHFEQAGDAHNAGTALVNIADIFFVRGNLPAAAKTYQQVLDLTASLEDGDPSYPLYRLADVELARGRVPNAHRLAQQAVDSIGPKRFNEDDAISELGDVLLTEDDLKGAQLQYEKALSIRQTKGSMLSVAGSQLEFAEIALEERHPEQAEALLRIALTEFERENADPGSTIAYTLLSRAFLMEGKSEDASKAIRHAAQLGKKSPDPNLSLPISLQQARIAAASGVEVADLNRATARKQLRAAIVSARKLGYYQLECEARLELGALELNANPALGRSLLKKLADDTNARGLQLLSRKIPHAQ